MKKILRQDEMVFAKKLCQPTPFEPTPAERVLLQLFINEKLARRHVDGSLELTNLGADCYIATLDNA